MKKSRFAEEQISFALKEAETGTPVTAVIRRMGISEQTFYRWKQKYGGLGVGELRRLKQREEQNRNLKQLVANLSLDKHILQEVLSKKSEAGSAARLRRPGVRPVFCALSVDQGRPDASDHAHPGPRADLNAVRLFATLHSAAARGLAGEPQARPSALSGGRLQSSAPAASPARHRR